MDPPTARPPWLIVEALHKLKLPAPRIKTQALTSEAVSVVKNHPSMNTEKHSFQVKGVLPAERHSAPTLPKPTKNEKPSFMNFGSFISEVRSISGSFVKRRIFSSNSSVTSESKFSRETVLAHLSKFGSVDVRPWRRNQMLVATCSYDVHRKILNNARNLQFRVFPYNALRHSRLTTGLLWSVVNSNDWDWDKYEHVLR